MSNPDGTELPALQGSNPLAFLAALGTQAALGAQGQPRHLSWTTDITPTPVLTPRIDEGDLVSLLVSELSHLLDRPVLPDESQADNHRALKFKPEQLREYLRCCRTTGAAARLAFSLVAEPSYSGKVESAPTDFYFLAARQVFAHIARTTIEAVDRDDTKIRRDLLEGWLVGDADGPTLLWDVADDADHALSADNPSGTKKTVHSGAEALALLGLIRFPCFGRIGRPLTQGFSGNWKRRSFTWPMWSEPASEQGVEALLAHVDTQDTESDSRQIHYETWGVTRVFRSEVIRSDQGGFGSFRPPEDVWVLEETT